MIKAVAASIGVAAATEVFTEANVPEMLAASLESLADCIDGLTEIVEAYASRRESDEI